MTRFRIHMFAVPLAVSGVLAAPVAQAAQASGETVYGKYCTCLLYTSDAADE